MSKRFFILLGMSLGVVGCTPHQGLSDRFDTINENTEVIEIRLTNFEERLAAVEQEVGILRSYGTLPEGARWVDPSPSLAKVGGVPATGRATPQTGRQVEASSRHRAETPRTSPRSDIQAERQSGDTSKTQLATPSTAGGGAAHALSSVSAATPNTVDGSAHRPSGASASAIEQFTGQYGTQYTALSGAQPNSAPDKDPVPSLAPLKGTSTAQGGERIPPAVKPPQASSATSAVSGTGSLQGLPAGFRTGVRSYDEALAMYYRHEYGRSLKAFTSFIEGNKGHKLLPNALYWQGESAYSQGDYLAAILSFKSITSQYPKHAKSSDALLKIGMAYERLKDTDNAQFYWQVLVDDFPKSSAARVARGKMAR